MKHWYQTEYGWLKFSILWVAITTSIIATLNLNSIYMIIPSVGLGYIAYFVTKGIIYAWIINPYRRWKHRKQ